ncbi:MAG TPA: hypothetical protein VK617_17010 [Gemmatimonadaceae bacterium]|nr:hypothetical protein [Gemmatimonadaceae bacterium]
MDDERRDPAHLAADDLASYVDATGTPALRARVEAHLADCTECCAEVIAVSRLMRIRSPGRRWHLPAIAAVAAAIFLIVVGRQLSVRTESPAVLREPVITTTVAPTVVAPRGAITETPCLVWTSVPHADLYRITLFDDAGGSIWESQTRDTSAALPASIHLADRASYYWRIEAQTGWNRWVASDLIEFSIASPGR